MSAQRLTTLVSRILMGFSGSFLIHSMLEEYWMIRFWLHLSFVVLALIVCFCCEYNPRNNSDGERLKNDRANWAQAQALSVGAAMFMGGLMIWLT